MKEKKDRLFLARTVWESDKWRFFLMGLFCVLSVIPQFVSIYGLKLVVDLIVGGETVRAVLGAVGFLVVLECVHTTYASLYRQCVVPRSDLRIRKHLNDILFGKLTKLDVSCYQDKNFYETYTLGAKNSDSTVTEYIGGLETLISSILGLVMTVFMVVFIDWWILCVPLIAVIASLIFNFCIGRLSYRFSNSVTKKERFADYIKRIFFSPSYAKEMIVFPIKGLMLSAYDSTYEETKKITDRYSGRICALDAVSNVIFNVLGFGLILGFVSYRVMVMDHGIGDFVALANAGLAIVNGFMRVASVFPQLGKYKLFARNITDLLNYSAAIRSPEHPLSIPEDHTIEYRDVSFSYPFAAEREVLHHIDIRIEENRKIAIVGFNGSGKTTLTNLLLRLYDPVSGEIALGGNDIRKYDLTELRGCFNILFQDFRQYPLSIAEFVLMRSPETDEDDALALGALERAGLREKIEGLPHGLRTKISKEFDEEGETFSGGEMQKLLLARVFAQPQKILVLDEPSSALDALSENYIFDEILKNVHDKTVIFITHRLSAAKDADSIILMKNGSIVQQGTHAELMKRGGEYRTMFEMQAKKFELDPEEKFS